MGIAEIMLKAMYAMIIFVIFVLLFWKLWFLRDPERNIPVGKNIVSPADGRINRIISSDKANASITKGKYGKIDVLASDVSDNYTIISIVMTPLDVHVQRSPIAGKVLYTRHTRGSFRNAMSSGIAIDNEKNEILIEGPVKVKVIQIAGALARRIQCYVKKGQAIDKGDRIGLINLGSQVSIIIPSGLEVKVMEGQKVKAGETILAEIR